MPISRPRRGRRHRRTWRLLNRRNRSGLRSRCWWGDRRGRWKADRRGWDSRGRRRSCWRGWLSRCGRRRRGCRHAGRSILRRGRKILRRIGWRFRGLWRRWQELWSCRGQRRRRERRSHLFHHAHAANDPIKNAGDDPLAGELILIDVVGQNQRLQDWFRHVFVRREIGARPLSRCCRENSV